MWIVHQHHGQCTYSVKITRIRQILYWSLQAYQVTLGKCTTKENMVITAVNRDIYKWKMIICDTDIAVHTYSLSFIPYVVVKHWTYSTNSSQFPAQNQQIRNDFCKYWSSKKMFELLNPRLIPNPSKYSRRGENISQTICGEEWEFAFWRKIKE